MSATLHDTGLGYSVRPNTGLIEAEFCHHEYDRRLTPSIFSLQEVRPRRTEPTVCAEPVKDNTLITFLPYPDFKQSARVLDNKRLGKQRVEAYTIVRCLCGYHETLRRHPAVRMWDGHLTWLMKYYNEMVKEWLIRGFVHNGELLNTWNFQLSNNSEHLDCGAWPPWLGSPLVHSSHRAALLTKNPEVYGQFNWEETPKIEYFWPI